MLLVHGGVGFYGFRQREPTIPFGINYLIPINERDAYLDLGMGLTYTKAEVLLYVLLKRPEGYVHTDFWNYVPSLGFRKIYHSRILFRINFSPVINEIGFIPYLGTSIGFHF